MFCKNELYSEAWIIKLEDVLKKKSDKYKNNKWRLKFFKGTIKKS